MQFINRSKDKYLFQGNSFNYKLWVYDSTTFNFINNKPFENLRLAQENFNIDARTLNNYADTYTPYKELFLFYFLKKLKIVVLPLIFYLNFILLIFLIIYQKKYGHILLIKLI